MWLLIIIVICFIIAFYNGISSNSFVIFIKYVINKLLYYLYLNNIIKTCNLKKKFKFFQICCNKYFFFIFWYNHFNINIYRNYYTIFLYFHKIIIIIIIDEKSKLDLNKTTILIEYLHNAYLA